MALLGGPWWITTNRGTLNPTRLGAPSPVSGGYFGRRPDPAPGSRSPARRWHPVSGGTGTTTGPECASPSPPPWASLGCMADDARGHCYTTGTAAMPTRTTMQGPGAESPQTYRTPIQVERQPWIPNNLKGKTLSPARAGPPGKSRSLSQERALHRPALLGRIITPEVGGQGEPGDRLHSRCKRDRNLLLVSQPRLSGRSRTPGSTRPTALCRLS